ncbi:MAG: creatininase family protein [bacterium]|nr:creatininase family protein [bacterium]
MDQMTEMMWMTMEDIRGMQHTGAPVIVPFGTVEQHGSHLPLSTDTLQAYSIAVRAASSTGALVTPPVHYGQCSSTRNHPGTITISGDTLRFLAADIIRSLAGQGFIHIVLFSGHAGRIHMAALREAAESCIREEPGLRLAVICDLDLVKEVSADLLATPGDGHAGEIETSRMMHLYPDRVREPPPEEYPDFPPGHVVPDPERYWPGGVWGNPRAADGDKGRLIVERSAEALVRIVESLK